MSDEAAAWAEACARLAALGDRLTGADFPGDDRAGGFAHLAAQVVCWLAWSVFHADPARPAFQRQNDLITQWGGPNADNVYRHAPVDPSLRYRITGRMHACPEAILAVRAGFMHQRTWGTLHEVTLSDLGIGPGGEIDVTVGDGGAVPLPPGAATVSIREYYFDWRPAEPAVFTIECLGPADPSVPLPAAPRVAERLTSAVTAVEHAIEYWNTYLRDRRAEQPPNTFGPPFGLAKGLDAARYAFCFWELGPGKALVVECPVPDARYWSFQLYETGWFRLVDPAERQTSLNHTQARPDTDGRVRVVVAASDPAVPNWLDTGGRPTGLVTFRSFWGRGAAQRPRAAVVPFSDVRAALPDGTPTVGASSRTEALRRRRDHLAWRFRT